MKRKSINRITRRTKGSNQGNQQRPAAPADNSLWSRTLATFNDCSDLTQSSLNHKHIHFLYFDHLLDKDTLNREVMQPLEEIPEEELSSFLQNEQFEELQTSEDITEKIVQGFIAVFLEKDKVFVTNLYGPQTRSVEESETESTILGNHDAFIESTSVNLSLIRRRLKTPRLKVITLYAGEISRTEITLTYIEGLVDKELLQNVKERINDVEVDAILDSPMFIQMIDDAPYSFFPQYFDSERPDVVIRNLCKGKIAGFAANSPTAFLAPSNFFDFFHSPDDWSQRWAISSATRLLRMLAFFITLTFTAFYVAVTTYHYEMIPEALIIGLAESRNKVPFTPLIEALLMEITIELLREAGARLPTKIGQTIGIVGGIVIGQSAVQAGLVSNTLIIAVAISAIASFVMPNYTLSAGLRIARFGLILLAGALGNYGLLLGIVILLIHLSTLSSLSTPYFNPIAPLHPRELLRAILRPPYGSQSMRPTQARTHNKDDIKSIGARNNE
ncbi:spore germination protein [Salibacterium aidingense]|uniref:spore germination protein n=1 Tax=Salibacterium aidingense TaxID=384933 RepID=UPI00041412A2|nr:spore germination protein [Salibacterium aidingense]